MTEVIGRSTADSTESTAPAMVVVLDFGSQYSQLITRRVREAGVYSELKHFDTPWSELADANVAGIILSGGPASVYEAGAPKMPDWVLASGLPILGICYGMQLLADALGGSVEPAPHREYGPAKITIDSGTVSPLFAGLEKTLDVWMSHGDHVTGLPEGFVSLASSGQCSLCRHLARINRTPSSSTPKSRIPLGAPRSFAIS